jgi:hypothetical protein
VGESSDVAEGVIEPRTTEETEFLAMELSALDYLDPTLCFIRQKVTALKAHLEASNRKTQPTVSHLECSLSAPHVAATELDHGFSCKSGAPSLNGKKPTSPLKGSNGPDAYLMGTASFQQVADADDNAEQHGAMGSWETNVTSDERDGCSAHREISAFASAMPIASQTDGTPGQRPEQLHILIPPRTNLQSSAEHASDVSADTESSDGHFSEEPGTFTAEPQCTIHVPSGSSGRCTYWRNVVPGNGTFLLRCERV